jgi:hypothetical protein
MRDKTTHHHAHVRPKNRASVFELGSARNSIELNKPVSLQLHAAHTYSTPLMSNINQKGHSTE